MYEKKKTINKTISMITKYLVLMTNDDNKPSLKKTGVLKLNYVYKLQICKLMRNTITGFDVDHNTSVLVVIAF